jgi:cytochrome b561
MDFHMSSDHLNTDDHANADALDSGRYDRVLVLLHWLLALALFGQLVLGLWMVDLPKEPPGYRGGWFNVHKSIGLVIALFIVWRLGWRVTHRVPAAVTAPGSWQHIVSKLNHGLMYVCMLAMPVTGFIGSNFSQYPIKFFGYPLPRLFEPQPDMKALLSEIHELFAMAFMCLIALHLAAVVWHVLVKRDGLLQRMAWGRATGN